MHIILCTVILQKFLLDSPDIHDAHKVHIAAKNPSKAGSTAGACPTPRLPLLNVVGKQYLMVYPGFRERRKVRSISTAEWYVALKIKY